MEDNPMAPNFFVEAKGPDGSVAVVIRQAQYDGAIGARGMHSLQNYGEEEPIYDVNAYTYSSTYHAGHLKLYTHHPSMPATPGEWPEYYMTQLNSYAMTGERENFIKGATAFRNLRDLAKEHRDESTTAANAKARRSRHDAADIAVVQDDGSSPEYADCEEFLALDNRSADYTTSQYMSKVALPQYLEDDEDESQLSAHDVEQPAASFTTSFTSSFASGNTQLQSKRPRTSHSPPGPSHTKKHQASQSKRQSGDGKKPHKEREESGSRPSKGPNKSPDPTRVEASEGDV